MSAANTPTRWGSVAQSLHWVIALLILAQFVLAQLAENAGALRRENPAAALEQLALLARHKSIGITILALAVVRLVWRWTSTVPAMPAAMPGWQVFLARGTHVAFYALLFALPITGWITSSTANFPVAWFGLFTLPDLVGPNRELHEQFEEIHHLCGTALWILAAVHVAAALQHHFFAKDDVLKRMLPWRG